MSQQVRVAVIGASGAMGQHRLRQFEADPRCKLVAAYGRNMQRLHEATGQYQVRLTTDADEIYEAADVDAVVISIPTALHYEQVRKALVAGKHVHCEFPLTDSLEGYDELVALAEHGGLVLHHGMTARAESMHLAVKEALPKLGEPRTAYYRFYGKGGWYVDPSLRGDIYCTLHMHFMDQLLDLFGQPADVARHGIEKDEKVSAMVMLQWATGLVGIVEFGMGFADRPWATWYTGTILTTDGWLEFCRKEELQLSIHQGGEEQVIIPPKDTSGDQDARSFIDEILGTGGPLHDLPAGRKAIELCLRCNE